MSSGSEFRGKDKKTGRALPLAMSDSDDSDGEVFQPLVEDTGSQDKEDSPPSSRTRMKAKDFWKKEAAETGKDMDTGDSSVADTSGYTSASPAVSVSKEYKDELKRKKRSTKTGVARSVSAGAEAAALPERSLEMDSAPKAADLTNKQFKKLKFNSTNKGSGRLPAHGSFEEIVQNPRNIQPSNGIVRIRSEEYEQIASMIEVRSCIFTCDTGVCFYACILRLWRKFMS